MISSCQHRFGRFCRALSPALPKGQTQTVPGGGEGSPECRGGHRQARLMFSPTPGYLLPALSRQLQAAACFPRFPRAWELTRGHTGHCSPKMPKLVSSVPSTGGKSIPAPLQGPARASQPHGIQSSAGARAGEQWGGMVGSSRMGTGGALGWVRGSTGGGCTGTGPANSQAGHGARSGMGWDCPGDAGSHRDGVGRGGYRGSAGRDGVAPGQARGEHRDGSGRQVEDHQRGTGKRRDGTGAAPGSSQAGTERGRWHRAGVEGVTQADTGTAAGRGGSP